MTQKNVHIIGGGISGLYFAFLLSSHKNIQIHLYEKNSYFGGRIQTEYDNDGKVLFEKGPWRIHPSHHRILQLVKQLGLVKHEIHQKKHKDLLQKPCNGKITSSNIKNQITEYQNWCYEDSIQTANHKMLQTGYDMLLQRANGTRSYSYKKTFEDTERFFVLEKGFSSIISSLVEKLQKRSNVHLYSNYHVNDIRYQKPWYTLDVKIRKHNRFILKNIKAVHVIIASPPSSVETWKSLTLFPNTSMVSSLPLIHVYGKLSKQQEWNRDNEKLIVNSPISQIISSTFHNKWCQVSYAAGRFAMMLQNLTLVRKKAADNYIISEFSKYKKSLITNIRYFFWRHAVHYWNPNIKSSEKRMMERCITPHVKKYPNLYWIGEAISTKQGWMEGALETSLNLYKKLTCSEKPKKKQLPKEYVIYDGRILNVEKWKKIHPGSKEAIENHLFEDITELWNLYHPKEASKYMVLLEDIYSEK